LPDPQLCYNSKWHRDNKHGKNLNVLCTNVFYYSVLLQLNSHNYIDARRLVPI